jgi:hypothetical protein
MRKFLVVAVSLLFWPSTTIAQSANKGEALCYQIQNSVNALADFTDTRCFPSAGNTPKSLSFIILSSKPVFSVEASKKAWVLVAVAASGDSLNKQSSIKADELWLSDTNLLKGHIAYVIPASLAKSLQRRVKNGQINIETMYSEINRNLVRKTVQKK